MADLPLGGRSVTQKRDMMTREFQFFRDQNGKPWMTVKSSDGADESFAFRDTEFDQFCEAANQVRAS